MFNEYIGTKEVKNIHFRGIGGVSMSGIAATLKLSGYNVTGSDDYESNYTKKLEEMGIVVSIGKNLDLVRNADIFIYTDSISEEDEELILAKELDIPLLTRAEALGAITKKYDSIAVAGTNGKTTTTAMTSVIFLEANKDPSIQIGAYLKNIDANYRIGNSDKLILEACEYKENFYHFEHKTAVILNIDCDHLDYYRDIEHIKEAFYNFAVKTQDGGNIVLNLDDQNSIELLNKLNYERYNYNIYTFGLNPNADVSARNIEYDDYHMRYDLIYKNSNLGEIRLNVFGNFNVLNSLAAISVALAYGIGFEKIRDGLAKYYGADRRFEYRGKLNGASVYDDYAHNPTKVRELSTAAKMLNKKTWIVFEPHTYTRTIELFNDFVNALKEYDNIIVTEIFAAREKNIYNISSRDLVEEVNLKYNKSAVYIKEYIDIIKYLKENVKEDELVLFVGAGSINKLYDLVEDENI